MASQLRVYVPEHPLIKHWLGVARDENTPPVLFKTAMGELGRWLTYEAARYWLPTVDTEVKTPLAIAKASLIDPQTPFVIVPILRAGLALVEGAQGLLPLAKIYHLGLVRNETTLEPSLYLNKLPERFAPGTHLLLLDPMLATGNTIMAALDLLMARDIDANLIRLVSVVAAPTALQKLSNAHPNLTIYTAMIDEQLNDRGYIVPGLGDAGDRCFGT
ncbi:uracil phosphoribosyltransferase [Synechocystis sp. PCC 6803]|uniref:Uracil phosphoribosyltransferase n=1 Tax=Synechocystis sp. (strain ATCC 27184 / PCC 6803 / Kazusa) TaxID=1111708 RepID=UPP_SYNY3|nr:MULTISPECIES: uracil phosphoribosyltransferase [unclassified Synechocystis]P72753.1 RecName: Full=Uracil phosphoribosyltransferase; AltName: Full=UMP pyrophosphorylase; AltName: Full=UPRTase [Synechocystis sp. PCC 6803 substr. Kazusa]BAM50474.1 uracil phosphoribosyltransferase [Synechocystis sp. PCC 6803] [Bacillus subtilis BEST7613]AGF50457.1 uracil phosphoribosyltransferase [Synechocystis sp. PCC 6803]ALJ66541.1 uracil phosphoribosyltransferase [Synechocystis sp. PCC 6803]AVP88385.1 uraci